MNVLISGASGLVGQALIAELSAHGHSPIPLLRGKMWDPTSGDLHLTESPDAIVHLAGESIASGRWTKKRKNLIRSSRIEATERLALSLTRLRPRPAVFISASAIGYYGNRGDEILNEQSASGADFLARVATDWEAAAHPLTNSGIRVVHLRFGMILSREGGALARMLPIFRLGLGGKLGSGAQWVSWIALRDVVRIIEWALITPQARGAYNAVSPHPVRNAEFTRAVGHALHRPTFLPVPSTMLRLVFGELAEALLLSSQRVMPARLLEEGFRFEITDLKDALSR